jgi:hypothetical protein
MTEKATATTMMAYSREASGTPAVSTKLPSRIGTAPLSPGPQDKQPFSPGQPDRQQQQADQQRTDHHCQQHRQAKADPQPASVRKGVQADGEAEHEEGKIPARLARAEWNRSISPL